MTKSPAPSRSGCAVISGIVLIGTGSLFLANNIFGFLSISTLRVAAQALTWFGAYWPVLFIAWGAFKILDRFRHPGRAHVSAAEIVVLAWILVLGLAIRGVERIADEIATDVSLDEFAGIFGPELLGPAYREIDSETFELGVAGTLMIDNELGEVVILGSDEPSIQVRVTKQIHSFSDADARHALSGVRLQFSSEGERARLHLVKGDDSREVRTDLEIRVPRSTSVQLKNGRGGVRIEDLAAPAHIETTHGDVAATNLSAGLDVRTSHARIRLDQLSGPIDAVNEHGEIFVVGADGDVRATTEHSSIVAERVDGNVVLKTEHGSVRVADVSGTVAIAAPYSDVSVERAGAGVSIAANHRPIFVHDVGGGVDVVARSARILVGSVERDVSIENHGRPVSVTDVRGEVSVTGEQSGVEIQSVQGTIRVQSSHEDIYVSDFGAGLSIQTSHANVDIAAVELADAVDVETSYGSVSLSLPKDAAIVLLALTRDGSLRSDFSELGRPADAPTGEQRWEGTLGAGIHAVTLKTSYGDITLTEDAEK